MTQTGKNYVGDAGTLWRHETTGKQDWSSWNPTSDWDKIIPYKCDGPIWACLQEMNWSTVVNAMIEKIPGRPFISKLRVIHLIKSGLDLLTGIWWGRQLMQQGEQLNEFSDAQGGSRSDRSEQKKLLFKHIAYSIVRLTETNFTSFDNDAKSCNNCMLCFLHLWVHSNWDWIQKPVNFILSAGQGQISRQNSNGHIRNSVLDQHGKKHSRTRARRQSIPSDLDNNKLSAAEMHE